MSINRFADDYFFLSNFYPCPIQYNGYTYQNSEAAFQAQKCPERISEFIDLPPNKAKALGRRVSLRPDWQQVKDDVMYEIVCAKFNNEELKKLLLATNNEELVEGNTWNDTYWGVNLKTGKGENHLGKILMRIREEIKNE